MSFAVLSSQTSEREMKSPNDDIRSAPRALAYAHARGLRSKLSSTQYIFFSTSLSGRPIAAPAGETCLNEVAAGLPVAFFSSFTSCQPLKASRRFIYPGRPLRTVNGSSPLFSIYTREGFWFGLHPYLSSNSFIIILHQMFLFMILLSNSPVSMSINLVNSDTLLS